MKPRLKQPARRVQAAPPALPSSALALLGFLLALVRVSPAGAQVVIEKVSPRFRPGPYSAIEVDPNNPERVAIATEDGHVLVTQGQSRMVLESLVVPPRRMDAMALRGRGLQSLSKRTSEYTRRAILLFLTNLRQGNPPARWSFWMGLTDPITYLTDIALPPPAGGRMLVATPQGVLMSDRHGSAWTKVLGASGVMSRDADLSAFSVAVNPFDTSHALAGTSEGIFVSRNGGQTFHPHPDPKSAGDIALQILFDPAQAGLVFAVTPGAILVSDDGGEKFTPGLSVDGEIRSLSLSPEAAYLATSEGLEIVLPDRVETYLEGKDLVGAVGWGGGYVLAATAQTLYLVAPDGSARPVLRTNDSDPYIGLAGQAGNVWLLSRLDVRRLRYGERRTGRSRGYRAPRLLLSQRQIERVVLKHTGLGDPEHTRFHERWYAKLVPRIVFEVSGELYAENALMRDGTFPIRYRHAEAVSGVRNEWGVFAVWDLSKFVFGDTGDVSNAHLLLESNRREDRKAILREVRWRFRELTELVALMSEPPPDPESELLWDLRLQEHASYLEFLAGREVVEREEMQ